MRFTVKWKHRERVGYSIKVMEYETFQEANGMSSRLQKMGIFVFPIEDKWANTLRRVES